MMQFRYHVVMEGGDEWDVTADQRDVAAFEVQPFGVPLYEASGRIYTFSRFLAYNAGRRTGRHQLTWAAFSDKCVSADRTDLDDEAGADPGNPAASAGS